MLGDLGDTIVRAQTISIVHENATAAGRDAAAELLDQLGSTPDVVLVFVSSVHDPAEVLEGLWSRLPRSVRLIGCSSFAEIGSSDALAGSVTVMGIVFATVEWELFRLDPTESSDADAGRTLGEKIRRFDPKLVIVLPDGLRLNSTKFVGALQEVLGRSCAIVGGLASEGFQFQRTTELFDRDVIEGGAVAMALRGPVSIATAARAGFQPVGIVRTCTAVDGDRVILELDGHSALEMYKDYLGEKVAERPNIGIEFPLAMIERSGGDYMESDERSQVIRAVRELDDQRGALVCSGDIYLGAKVRMTRASKEDLIQAAQSATAQAVGELSKAKVALLFNCAGRKAVLGARHHEEIAAAFGALAPDVARVGFYTYGEIAPVADTNMYHDETFTLALIGTE